MTLHNLSIKRLTKFHKRLLAIATVFVLPSLPLFAHPGKVIRTLNAPGGFCTGLAFDGECLWVADYQADKLFKIDPDTGGIIGSVPSPGFWPMGLAWDGKTLWNVDRKRDKIFQVDPKDGTILKVIDAPCKEPEGLAWDGKTLWVSEYKKGKIIKIDLSDGTAVQTLTAPAGYPGGLAFDGMYLWCSARRKDEVYMIEPASGDVLMILDADLSVAPENLPRFKQAMTDANPCVRYWGVTGCVVLGRAATGAERPLVACLGDSEPVIRIQAARALAGMGKTEAALPVIRRSIENGNPRSVLQATLAIDECNLLSLDPSLRSTLTRVTDIYASRIVKKLLGN